MSCYNPRLISLTKNEFNPKSGKGYVNFLGPALDLPPPDTDSISYKLVPCHECSGCRLDYSRDWANRMMLEFDHTKKAIFLTLTYNPQEVPVSEYDDNYNPRYFTLRKSDCPKFFKRLRSRFKHTQIRYYGTGEYGPASDRPHYHFIVFGLGIEDIPDLQLHRYNEFHNPQYISKILEDTWSHGFIEFTNATYRSMAYVARYVTKKQKDKYVTVDESVPRCFLDKDGKPHFTQITEKKRILIDSKYALRSQEREDSMMSTNPGIGFLYPIDHPDCFKSTTLTLSDGDDSYTFYWPKKVLEKFALDIPPDLRDILDTRSKVANDAIRLELQKTDKTFYEYLQTKAEAFDFVTHPATYRKF